MTGVQVGRHDMSHMTNVRYMYKSVLIAGLERAARNVRHSHHRWPHTERKLKPRLAQRNNVMVVITTCNIVVVNRVIL